jgi:hypothetical protein
MADTNIDFDTKAAALLRRRKMADLLQQQSLEGFKPPPIQGRTSFLEPLGQMAKAFAGMHMGKEADAAEAENEAARTAALKQLWSEMPQGTPAVPGTPGMPALPGETRAPLPSAGEQPLLKDILQPGAVPPTPQLGELGMQPELPKLLPAQPAIPGTLGTPAKPPTSAELLPWVTKMAQVGGVGKDISKAFMQRLAENVAPKTMSEFEAATTEENRINHMAVLAQKEEAAKAVLADKNATREQQAQAARELNETRIEVARIAASARRGSGEGGSDKYKTTTDVGDQGQRLVQSNGVYHQVLGDGTIDPKPYGGVTTPKTTQEKNVAAAFGSEKTIAQLDSALAAMDKDPNLFSTRKALGSILPDAGDLSAKVGGVTAEQGKQRAQIAEMSAQRAHALYGAALTESEQRRAKGFIVNLSDGPSTARWKLEGLKQMEMEFKDRMPSAAQAAVAARTGGAAPAAAAPSGGGWSATVVPKP